MGWGTYYKFDGYLSHIRKNEIDAKREDWNIGTTIGLTPDSEAGW